MIFPWSSTMSIDSGMIHTQKMSPVFHCAPFVPISCTQLTWPILDTLHVWISLPNYPSVRFPRYKNSESVPHFMLHAYIILHPNFCHSQITIFIFKSPWNPDSCCWNHCWWWISPFSHEKSQPSWSSSHPDPPLNFERPASPDQLLAISRPLALVFFDQNGVQNGDGDLWWFFIEVSEGFNGITFRCPQTCREIPEHRLAGKII